MDSIVGLYAAHIARLRRETARALEACGLDAVVIHSGRAQKIRNADDQYWPVAPTPAFAHWLPATLAGSALVVRGDEQPVLLRATEDNFWEGPPHSEGDHYRAQIDVVELDPGRIAERLPSGRVAFIGDDSDDAARWGLADAGSPDLEKRLDAVRARKSAYERACVAEANRRASRGHDAVIERFRSSNASELDLHLVYLGATAQDDSETPYKNIVALGKNAATLHHVAYGRSPAPAERSLLIDAGATCFGYASDITRTAVVGTSAAARLFSGLVDRIETLQRELASRLRPGVPYESLHDAAHELLAQALIDLEIVTGSVDTLVETGITRAFFPHGLGHSLGLQVHDVGCRETPPAQRNPFLRTTCDVEAGHIFTVEPGCYFIDSLLQPLREGPGGERIRWDQIDALSPFGGVRIEDNLAVLDGKAVNLTRDNWGRSP